MTVSELSVRLLIRNYGALLRVGSVEKIKGLLMAAVIQQLHSVFADDAKRSVDAWLGQIFSFSEEEEAGLAEAIRFQGEAADSRERLYVYASEMLAVALFEVLVWKGLAEAIESDLKKKNRFELTEECEETLTRNFPTIEAVIQVPGKLEIVLPDGGPVNFSGTHMSIPLNATPESLPMVTFTAELPKTGGNKGGGFKTRKKRR